MSEPRLTLSIPQITPQEAAERASQRELRFLLVHARKWMLKRAPATLLARIDEVLAE